MSLKAGNSTHCLSRDANLGFDNKVGDSRLASRANHQHTVRACLWQPKDANAAMTQPLPDL